MAIKKFNTENFREQVVELADKDYTDWHSKNTIIFGSLIEDGWDWGREDWTAYTITDEALLTIRPRINQKIEDRFFFRELGTLPPAAFKKNLKSLITDAVTKRGLLYQQLFDGIDYTIGESERLKRRSIHSDYPQAQLQVEQKDYATSADEDVYEKETKRDQLSVFLELYEKMEEPDSLVLEDIDKCFSQLFNFTF